MLCYDRKWIWIIVFFVFTVPALSQQPDSLLQTIEARIAKSIYQADSVTRLFQVKSDSLHLRYGKQRHRIDSMRNKLQGMMDSLRLYRLPLDGVQQKLDSLEKQAWQHITKLTDEFEQLKSKTLENLSGIELPPPLSESLSEVKQQVQKLALPSHQLLPEIGKNTELISMPRWDLPELGEQITLPSGLGEFSEKVAGTTSEAGKYMLEGQGLITNNLEGIKDVDQTIEQRLLETEGMEQLKQGSELMANMAATDSLAVAEAMKKVVNEEMTKVAKNHFAGKEEVLQQAMDNMSKLKGKYAEVQSMADLPEKLPNPLKGIPFHKRIEVLLTFQIQKSDYLLLDINPMLMYRPTPRFLFGGGWNVRLPFDDFQLKMSARVYGPRLAFEYRWGKGVSFRMLPELMNTCIPPQLAQRNGMDPTEREWVPGLFLGIKKDFTVCRKIRGNTEMLFNVYNPDGMSPYADRLSLRFGFGIGSRE